MDNLVILNEQQFETIKRLIKFLLELNGVEDKYYNEIVNYQKQIGVLFGKSYGTLSNTLYGSPPNQLSRDAFNNFGTSFKNIVYEFKTSQNEKYINRHIKIFNEWVSSLKVLEKLEHHNELVNSEVISLFRNSKWICYEVEGDTVVRSALFFYESVLDYECCQMDYIYLRNGTEITARGSSYYQPIGQVLICTSYDYPVVQMGAGFIQFYITVDYTNKDISLCLGQKTFVDTSRNQLTTKNLLIIKLPQKADINEFWMNSSNYLEAVSYFHELRMNRITSSPIGVHGTDSLKRYNETRRISSFPKSMLGAFKIFYQSRIDNKDSTAIIEFMKSYNNRTATIFKKKQVDNELWVGKTKEITSNSSLRVFLDGPFSIDYFLNDNYTMLADREWESPFPISLFLNVKFDEEVINTITGILIDSSSGLEGVVPQLVVLVKIENNNDNKIDEISVRTFIEEYGKDSNLFSGNNNYISTFQELKEKIKNK